MKAHLILFTLINLLLSCCLVPHHKYVTNIGAYTIDINSDEKTDLQKILEVIPVGTKESDLELLVKNKLDKELRHVTWNLRDPYITNLTLFNIDCLGSKYKKIYIYCENGKVDEIIIKFSVSSL